MIHRQCFDERFRPLLVSGEKVVARPLQQRCKQQQQFLHCTDARLVGIRVEQSLAVCQKTLQVADQVILVLAHARDGEGRIRKDMYPPSLVAQSLRTNSLLVAAQEMKSGTKL